MPTVMTEATEALFLLTTSDPSLDVWLRMQNPQVGEIRDFHTIGQFLQAMYQWPVNVATLESTNGDKLPICGIVGYLTPHLDSLGHIQLSPADNQGPFSVQITIESDFGGKKGRFDAAIRFPGHYEKSDITQQLCSFCAIPVRIISLILENQRDKLPEDWKGVALCILAVLEEGGASQRTLLTTTDLLALFEKAKFGLDDGSTFLSTVPRNTRDVIIDLLKQQTSIQGVVEVFQRSLGPISNQLHSLIPDPEEAFSQSSQDACAFAIAVLHCLHYASLTGVNVIKDLQVALSLDRVSETGSHDIGLGLALHLLRVGESPISVPPSAMDLGEKIPVSLYAAVESGSLESRDLRIPKYLLPRANLPKVIGVRYGNLYSSLAIVSVGILPRDILSYWSDRVAAIIELDDRRGYIAGIPDPWPYHVRKICQIVAANPNIRSVLFVGDTSLCKDTLSLLSQSAIPRGRGLPSLTQLLLARYARQVVWTGTLDDLSLRASLPQSYTKVTSLAYMDDSSGTRMLSDMPAFAESFSLPEAPTSKIIRFPSVDPHFATVDTMREAHYAILYALQQFGKPALPDELGYHYIELADYTVEVMDLTRDKTAYGTTLADLEQHYQNEWLNPEGRHGKRLMHQFGSNQLDELAKRIAELVKNRQASRRLIIYVADPYHDRSTPLGLMLIYFNLRGLPPEPVCLDATFLWRSFEALFGPGYSWYGAYRLIEDVVNRTNDILAKQGQFISLGRFSCIMLNLHLFDDDLSRSLTAEFMATMMEETKQE